MESYDAIIVGAGGCGLVAALSAADAGKKVLILEKLETPGGNTTLSTGSVPGAATSMQAKAGIEDSPERMVKDVLEASGPHEFQPLAELVAKQSAEMIDWLTKDHSVGLYLVEDYLHVGHSVHRLHAPMDRNGANLTADLVAACERAGVEIRVNTPVKEILYEVDGSVHGVLTEGFGTTRVITSSHVVLATNGFANNREMLQEWIPEMADAKYFGGVGSTGEGIEWAVQAGGELANISSYQAYATVATPEGDILSWTTVERGAIIVDVDGDRFADESVGYSGFAEEVVSRGGKSITVFDQEIYDYVAKHEPRFVKLITLECIIKCDTTQELAHFVGCEVEAIENTLDEVRDVVRGDTTDRFGRSDFNNHTLSGPYYACHTVPGLFHTQGGVKVDEYARVIRKDGSLVPGLFAGGGVAAGFSGKEGATGYASGNGLGAAVVLGYQAGKFIGTMA